MTAANASHGKRREPSDYRRAYQIAVRYKLVSAADSPAVKDLLVCSSRWARDLTAKARETQVAARDEEIKAKKAEGKSNQQVAAETGVGKATVDRVINAPPKRKRTPKAKAGPQRQSAVSDRSAIEADPDDPRQTDLEEFLADPAPAQTGADIARAKLAEMETPRAQRWHKALGALREVNQQARPATGRRHRAIHGHVSRSDQLEAHSPVAPGPVLLREPPKFNDQP